MSHEPGAMQRVAQALEDMRLGKMVILVDDEDRENEGDLVLAADRVTPEAINFMATHARGLICLAMDDALVDRLELPMMVRENRASLGTAFTVSIEAASGVSTGISARDRAHTIASAIADHAKPSDLVSPGHVFPLRARRGGVLVRTGQTEGSVDLARLAGCKPAGVICEIMRPDGEMARRDDLLAFAAEHHLTMLSVADIIAYRISRERIVQRKHEGALRPASLGLGDAWRAVYYDTNVEDTEYVALVRGDVAAAAAAGQAVMVRVQSLDPLGDAFGLRGDMDAALRAIEAAGVGVFMFVYSRSRTTTLRSFERWILAQNPHRPADSSEALRDFGLGAQVLADVGCQKIRLLATSERRVVGIEGFGIEIVEHVPIAPAARRAG